MEIGHRAAKKRLNQLADETKTSIIQKKETIQKLKEESQETLALAKTHYASLIKSGVKIYEYTPGFVHAKVFVSDDCKAVVGTINLDYRSLYHHFECATYMYKTSCISEIEEDFQKTLEKCRIVTTEMIKKETIFVKLLGCFMKVMAPLL